MLPDGKGGKRSYNCKADYELVIDGSSRATALWAEDRLSDGRRRIQKYRRLECRQGTEKIDKSFHLPVSKRSSSTAGREAVFDTTQDDQKFGDL